MHGFLLYAQFLMCDLSNNIKLSPASLTKYGTSLRKILNKESINYKQSFSFKDSFLKHFRIDRIPTQSKKNNDFNEINLFKLNQHFISVYKISLFHFEIIIEKTIVCFFFVLFFLCVFEFNNKNKNKKK